MATTILQSRVKDAKGKVKDVSTTVNVTHNNARLLHHSDGETYEFIGLNASSNRIYRNTRKQRG